MKRVILAAAVAVLSFVGFADDPAPGLTPAALPEDYLLLDGACSDGNGQYVDTEYVFKTKAAVVCGLKVLAEKVTMNQNPLGTPSSGKDGGFGINFDSTLCYRYGKTTKVDGSFSTAVKEALLADYTPCAFSNEVWIAGTKVLGPVTGDNFPVNEQTFYIYSGNGSPMAVGFSYVKLYDGGVLVRDYLPCKDPSGTVGLWDSVERKFRFSAKGSLVADGEGRVCTLVVEDNLGGNVAVTPSSGNYFGVSGDVEFVAPSSDQLECQGAEIYEFDGSAWTLVETNTTSSFTLTLDVAKRTKVSWQWKSALGMDEPKYVSSGFATADIAVMVTGIGKTASQATLTLAYGTSEDALDSTVVVNGTATGEWHGTLQRLVSGVTYYVKATLTNDAEDDPVESGTIWFVQQEVDEPGIATSSSYAQNDHLVAFWDGYDNIAFEEGDRSATTWADISGNGFDWTLADGTYEWTDRGLYLKNKGRVGTLATKTGDDFKSKVKTIEFVYANKASKHAIIFGPGFGSTTYLYTDTNNHVGFHNSKIGVGVALNSTNCFSVVYSGTGDTPDGVKDFRVNGAVRASEGMGDSWSSGLTEPVLGDRTSGGLAANGELFAIRIYDVELTGAEREQNYKADVVRYLEGRNPVGTLQVADGRLTLAVPASGAERKATFYWGGIYGGTNTWTGTSGEVTIPAGATTVSFPKPDGWGKTVWYARAKVGEGDAARWTKTLEPEPPAALGMEQTLFCASSSPDSSDIVAEVSGIGRTSSEATLTFAYGTAQDALDSTVRVTVTDAGTWRATLTGLEVGTHYYVQATLANGVDDPVTSDVFEFDQPDVEEGSGSSSALVSTVGFSGSWQKLFDLGGLVIKPDWSNVTIGLGHLTGAGCNNDDEWGRNPRVNANGELEFQYACIPDSLLKIGKGALKVENGAVYGKQVGSYYVNKSTISIEIADVDDPEQSAKYNTSNVTQPNGYKIDKVTCIIKSEIVLKPMNGGFAASMVPAADERTAYLYASETYGGTDGWGDPIETVAVPAGAGRAEFARVADWGTTLRYARVKIVDGGSEMWSRTYAVPPPAEIGVEKPAYVSSVFGSAVVGADVTGLGLTATSATLTFKYGATDETLDGAVEVSVTGPGEWTATLPHLVAGRKYYVQAVLSNDVNEVVTSDVFEFDQPKFLESGNEASDSYMAMDSLVAQWDGIDNAGVGLHDGSAKTWADLTGNNHTLGSIHSSATWTDDAFVTPTTAYSMAATISGTAAAIGMSDYKAYEIVFAVDGMNNYCGLVIGFGNFKGLALWDGTGGNSRGFQVVDSGRFFTCDYDDTGRLQQLYVDFDGNGNPDKAFCDGAALGTATKDSSWTQSSSGIGYTPNGNWSYYGRIAAIRLYDRQLTDEEREWNRQVDEARFVAGARPPVPMSFENGGFVVTAPASDSPQAVYFYADEAYGGTDGWGEPVGVVTLPAGARTASFPKPAGWGETVWFARAKVGDGANARWSATIVAEPPAALGMEQTLFCDSSSPDSSDIVAEVSGIGRTAESATLTFAYGTAQDALDNTVEVSVTESGKWRGTLPQLGVGAHYYVQATLANGVDDPVTSDVFEFDQPDVEADSGSTSTFVSTTKFTANWQKLFDLNGLVIKPDWSNVTIGLGHLSGLGCDHDDEHGRNLRVNANGELEFQYACLQGGYIKVAKGAFKVEDGAVYGKQIRSYYHSGEGAYPFDAIDVDNPDQSYTEGGVADYTIAKATCIIKSEIALKSSNGGFAAEMIPSANACTAYLYAGATYGGTDDWGEPVETVQVPAGAGEIEFARVAGWGSSLHYARVKIVDGTEEAWSRTVAAPRAAAGVGKPAYVSSVFGSAVVAANVTGLGLTATSATLTFKYGATDDTSDGEVVVSGVTCPGEWSATLPHLIAGREYHVKAVLSNDVNEVVTSDAGSFVQPENAEPGLYTFDVYAKGGLVAHWDGIYNVGVGQHDDAATGWTDLSTGGHDLAGISVYGSFTSDGEFRKSKNGAKKFSFGLAAETYEVVCDLTDYSSGWFVPLSLSDTYYPSMQISGGKLEVFYGSNKYGFKINVPDGRKFTLACCKSGALFVNGVPAKDCPGYVSYNNYWGNNEDCTFGASSTSHSNSGTVNHGFYAIRLYGQELSAEEIALNAEIDRRRFFGGASLDVGLEFQNGEFVVTAPASDGLQTVCFYASETYGGTNDWPAPLSTTLPAGTTTASFAKPEGWGRSVWFARAKVGDGANARWSATIVAEPPAPLGVEKPKYVSSAFGSSEVAAQVTGLGKTASEATLTFFYGTTSAVADGKTAVTVTDVGEWRGTIPHCIAGQTYYVKAVLSNDVNEVVTSDVAWFVQPEEREVGLAPGMRADLPSEYVLMKELTATGTEYIVTDFKPTKTMSFELKCGNLKKNDVAILAQDWAWDHYLLPVQGNVFKFNASGNTICPDATIVYGTDYLITAEPTTGGNGLVTIVNCDTGTSASRTCSLAAGGSGNLALFAANNGNNASQATIYSFKTWEGAELVHDMLPVWKTDTQQAGLYDFVAKRFYPSSRANVPFPKQATVGLYPFELRNGRFALTLPPSDAPRSVSLCSGKTYGGTDGWTVTSEPVTVSPGEAMVIFEKPAGWGSDVFFARAKVEEGGETYWSQSLVWEPAAALGMDAALARVSSAFGEAVFAARVTGVGAGGATLTFAYGTTPAATDGKIVLSVTDKGEWRATIPHLIGGQTYYVQATLKDVSEATVASDLFSFVQECVLEPGSPEGYRPELPAGYVQMEKLTSTGSEYVLTDFVPNNMTSSEAVFGEFVWKNASVAIFGQSYAGSCYLLTPQSNKLRFYGSSSGTLIQPVGETTIVPTDDYRFEITPTFGGNGWLRVRNLTSGNTNTVNDTLACAAGGQLALFGSNAGGYLGTFSLYSFKAWKDGVPALDLVPAYETASGRAGLWDFVDAKFHASSSATPFAQQAFVELLPIELKGGTLTVTVPASDTVQTVSFHWGGTYGGVEGWGAPVRTVQVAAGETTASFALTEDWGDTKFFARAKLGEGEGARWTKTVVWQDPNIPSVSLGSLDGLGGDTIVVKGTVDSLGTGPCTLTCSTGASADALIEPWTELDGATVTETGDFELTLFENDTAASRCLRPGETYFVRVELTDANGKVAWSSVKSVTMASAAVFKSVSDPAYAKRVMTVTAAMSDLGMTGETEVQLWVGADAGSLVMVTNVVVANANANFTLSYELANYETPFVWQLKAVNTAQGKTTDLTTPTAEKTSSAPDSATYIWTGAGADNKWSTKANWSDDKDGDCLHYPQTKNATAKFDKDADVEIDLPRNGTTLNLYSLNLGTADIDVRFHSADTNNYGLVLNGLTVPGQRSRWTLDHALVYRAGSYAWANGSTVVLTNGACLYINNCQFDSANATVKVLDGSWLDIGEFRGGNNGLVVVSNATVNARGHDYIGYNAGAMTVRFEGTHPKWRHTVAGNHFRATKDTSVPHLDFFVPVGGYQSAPYEAIPSMTYKMGNNGSGTSSAYPVAVNVLPDSPAARVDAEIMTPLVIWPGVGINTEKIVEGALPNEKSGNAFVWGEGASPTSLAVTVVGSAHTDRLTVAGFPADVPDVGVDPSYGDNDGMTSDRTLTAPESYVEFAEGTRRAICTGWELYDVDPATQETGAEPVRTGDTNTCDWEAAGKWQKLVWQWRVESKVVAAAEEGGSVSPESVWVTEGETVTLAATPSDATSRCFWKWTGDVPEEISRDSRITLTVDQAKNVTAYFGHIHYISTSGDDSRDGTTPGKAYATLQKALSVSGDGDQVKVLAGTHDVSISSVQTSTAAYELTREISIIGEGRDTTVLQAPVLPTKHKLFYLENKWALLKGLMISDVAYVGTGENYSCGYGATVKSGRIVDCGVCNVTAKSANLTYAHGVSVPYGATDVFISNCVFRSIGGGALSIKSGGGRFYDIDVAGCNGDRDGGAVSFDAYANGSFMDGLRIVAGNSGLGLALLGNSTVQNVLVTSAKGGGIQVSNGLLQYATVANCTSTATDGRDGLYQTGGTVRYSIFANNGANVGVLVSKGTFVTNLTDKVVEGAGEGCIVGDPQFDDPENGVYTLQLASLAKDVADDPTVAFDLVRTARPVDGKNDLGCFERVSSGGALQAGFKVEGLPEGLEGASFTFVAVADGDLDGIEYKWYLDGSDQVAGTGATFVLAPGFGKHSVKLVVTNAKPEEVVVEKSDVIEVHPTHVFVSLAGSSTYPFDTWAKATTNVNEAMSALWLSSPELCTVEIAEGVYTDVDLCNMTFPVQVIGAGRDKTVVTAPVLPGSNRAFELRHPDALLSSLTVSNVVRRSISYKTGYGVLLSAGRILDCGFEAITDNGGNNGYAVAVDGAGTLISNCVFRSNPRSALTVTAAATVRDIVVEKCARGYYAGVVNINAAGALLDGLHMTGGTAEGLNVSAGTAQNVFIDGVKGTCGAQVTGGLLQYATVVNCTSSQMDGRDGLYQTGGTVRYSIFARNGVYAGALVTGGTFVTNLTDKVIANSGEGCLVGDPQFAAPENGDYNLTIGSAAKDVVDDPTVAFDVVRTPRPQGKKNDLGAFERVSGSGELVAGFKVNGVPEGLEGTEFEFEAVADGDLEGVEYKWYLDGSDQVAGTGETFVLAPGFGKHSVKLVVTNAAGGEAVVEKPDVVEVHPTHVFVSLAGSHTYPYETWEKAATNVNEAMSALWTVTTEPCTVEVAEGVFTDTDIVNMTFPVTVVGAGRDKTVVTAPVLPAETRAFEIKHAEAVLKSLTVSNAVYRGGQFFSGAGAYMNAGKVVDCCFTHIRYVNEGLVSHGFSVEGSGFVSNCVFRSSPKGGINISGSATVMDIVVEDCGTGWNGGQVDVPGGSPLVDGLRIVGGTGRGLYVGAGTVQNVLIDGVRNVGVEISGGLLQYATVVNCTSSYTDGRDGLSQTGGKVMYSIFARNGVNAGALVTGGTFVTNLTDKVIANSGEGCLVGDPQFAAPENGDYNLKFASPARDAAVGDASVAFDLVRTARPVGDWNDLGCYERPDTVEPLTAGFSLTSAPEGLPGTSFTFVQAVAGDLAGITYMWYVDGGEEAAGEGETLTITPPSGKHTVKLAVTNAKGEHSEFEAVDIVEVHPTKVFVSHEGSATYPYDTWAKAATNVNQAMTSLWTATPELCTVEVAEGVYTNVGLVNLNFPVEVVGAGRGKTVISAPKLPNGTRVFELRNEEAVLKSLAVSNAVTSGTGNGFAAQLLSGKIVDCLFSDIKASSSYAVYLESAGTLVSNCVFRSLSTGALRVYGASTVSDMLVEGCGSTQVSIENANARVERAVVRGGTGLGVQITGGALLNSLVCDNTNTSSTAGISQLGGTMVNCTIAGNVASAAGKYSAVLTGGAARNCLFVGETDKVASISGSVAVGGNVISDEPEKVFTDRKSCPYHLKLGSPAIDVGLNGNVTTWGLATDLDGHDRIWLRGKRANATVDAGCYEFSYQGTVIIVR